MLVPAFGVLVAAAITFVLAVIIWSIPPFRRLVIASSWLAAAITATVSVLLFVAGWIGAKYEFRWFPHLLLAGLLSAPVTAAIVLVRLISRLRGAGSR